MKGLKGHPEVIDFMNELLAGELAARDQYFIHSRMYAEWGYNKLFERISHEVARFFRSLSGATILRPWLIW